MAKKKQDFTQLSGDFLHSQHVIRYIQLINWWVRPSLLCCDLIRCLIDQIRSVVVEKYQNGTTEMKGLISSIFSTLEWKPVSPFFLKVCGR